MIGDDETTTQEIKWDTDSDIDDFIEETFNGQEVKPSSTYEEVEETKE